MSNEPDLWHLLDGWFADRLTPDERSVFERRLQGDPGFARLFVALSRVEAQLPQAARRFHAGAADPDQADAFHSLTDRLEMAERQAGQVSRARLRSARPPRRRQRRRRSALSRAVPVIATLVAVLLLVLVVTSMGSAGQASALTLVSADDRTQTLRPGEPTHRLERAARLTVDNRSLAELEAGTRLRVDRFDSQALVVYLSDGAIAVDVAPGSIPPLTVRTEDLSVRVLGTRYHLRHDPSGSTVRVREGRVAVTTAGGEHLELTAGQSHTVSRAFPPVQEPPTVQAPSPEPPPPPATDPANRARWGWHAERADEMVVDTGMYDPQQGVLRSRFTNPRTPRHSVALTPASPWVMAADDFPTRFSMEIDLPAGGEVTLFLTVVDDRNQEFVANFLARKQLQAAAGWQSLEWHRDELDSKPPVDLPERVRIKSLLVETIDGKRPFTIRGIALQAP